MSCVKVAPANVCIPGYIPGGILLAGIFAAVPRLDAALQKADIGPQVLIGADDDNLNNPAIQPPNTAANQSLNNTDVLIGGFGNDILIGLLGDDVLHGGFGHDILIGGPEGSGPPNSDIIFGDAGNQTGPTHCGSSSLLILMAKSFSRGLDD
jgi:RTX calcium-binding nonapeptide repeat (4 copies)